MARVMALDEEISVGVLEARNRFSELIRRVVHGATVTVTRHGQPIVRLVPARPEVNQAEIDEMLAQLQTLSDDHFNAHPDEINWGHVGTLEHYASLLKRITDSAFSEGEHAE